MTVSLLLVALAWCSQEKRTERRGGISASGKFHNLKTCVGSIAWSPRIDSLFKTLLSTAYRGMCQYKCSPRSLFFAVICGGGSDWREASLYTRYCAALLRLPSQISSLEYKPTRTEPLRYI